MASPDVAAVVGGAGEGGVGAGAADVHLRKDKRVILFNKFLPLSTCSALSSPYAAFEVDGTEGSIVKEKTTGSWEQTGTRTAREGEARTRC